VCGFTRVPPLRDRPGLTRKFSLSSLAMTRRLASAGARARADQRRSHQIALARRMANKQRGFALTHIARAIARKIEIKKERSESGTAPTLRSAIPTPSQGVKTNVQTSPLRPQGARIEDPLYLAILQRGQLRHPDIFPFFETGPHTSGGLQFIRSPIACRRIDQRLPNRASVANRALDR
jgi:hypothetical protein